MTTEVEPNAKFLDTSAPRSAADWDALLAHQVDLIFPQELAILLSLDAWRNATRVLDAGCGNAYYLGKLQQFFPEKQYSGVDISPQLIEVAARRYPSIDFTASDFLAYPAEPRFDLVIMRFLVQHLKDFGKVLEGVERVLRPGGRLLTIESDLSNSRHLPPLPVFTDMLLTFERAAAAKGGLKPRLLSDAAKLVRDSGRPWIVEEERIGTSPRIGPFLGSPLLAVYLLWVELCERVGMFAFDFAAVREELNGWAANPATLSDVAMRMFVLTRDRVATA